MIPSHYNCYGQNFSQNYESISDCAISILLHSNKKNNLFCSSWLISWTSLTIPSWDTRRLPSSLSSTHTSRLVPSTTGDASLDKNDLKIDFLRPPASALIPSVSVGPGRCTCRCACCSLQSPSLCPATSLWTLPPSTSGTVCPPAAPVLSADVMFCSVFTLVVLGVHL